MSSLSADTQAHIECSFARQGLMAHLGARLASIEHGRARITLPYATTLTQQHGLFHAGVTSAIADTAGGYAALSTFEVTDSILTVDFSINLLAAARGERLEAEGRVIRAGRTITVCAFDVDAVSGETSAHVATGRQTLIRLQGRPDS